MPKCVFCGKEYHFHEGVTLVKNDGTINYLCSSKCRKNMKMKRRKVRWVHLSEEEKVSRKAKKK
ncbi:MAG: 50S ribosomal protein L24 [Nanoarchaeota archaeon]